MQRPRVRAAVPGQCFLRRAEVPPRRPGRFSSKPTTVSRVVDRRWIRHERVRKRRDRLRTGILGVVRSGSWSRYWNRVSSRRGAGRTTLPTGRRGHGSRVSRASMSVWSMPSDGPTRSRVGRWDRGYVRSQSRRLRRRHGVASRNHGSRCGRRVRRCRRPVGSIGRDLKQRQIRAMPRPHRLSPRGWSTTSPTVRYPIRRRRFRRRDVPWFGTPGCASVDGPPRVHGLPRARSTANNPHLGWRGCRSAHGTVGRRGPGEG